MAVINIEGKITSFKLSDKGGGEEVKNDPLIQRIGWSKPIPRPAELQGSTYKIKPNGADAYYITVNDVEVDGVVRPFEMLITTKNTLHQQWIALCTRLVTSIFRQTQEVRFILDEFSAVKDPAGGHWAKDMNGRSKYFDSLVSHIGHVLEYHISKIEGPVKELESFPEDDEVEMSETQMSQCPVCGKMALKPGPFVLHYTR